MKWEEILKDDKKELRNRQIQRAKSLFQEKGKQWAAQFGGQDNAKYDGLRRVVDSLEHTNILNDEQEFLRRFDLITGYLG